MINPDGSQTIEYLQFDGMQRIIANEGGVILDASTFAGGQKLNIPLLNQGIQSIYDALGEPTTVVVGSREKRFFNELLQSFVRYGGDGIVHQERQFGVSVMYYDSDFGSLPIIPSRYIQPAAGLTSAFVFCERTAAEGIIKRVAELLAIGSQPLAKIDDSERFMITEYDTLICRAPQWQLEVTNLSA